MSKKLLTRSLYKYHREQSPVRQKPKNLFQIKYDGYSNTEIGFILHQCSTGPPIIFKYFTPYFERPFSSKLSLFVVT